MIKISKILLSAFVLGFCLAQPASAENFTPAQKAEIEAMFKDFLMKNGETVIMSVDTFRQQQELADQAKASETIKQNIGKLASADAPSAGNPKGSVTVIEFFDYNCGYCKRVLPDIMALIEKDKDLRFVFREMPILGESSVLAAKWALAAHKQGKYFEYHAALMDFKGSKTEEELTKLAKKVGLDVEKVKADANSPEIQSQLDADIEMARMVGVEGTPAFIVGDEFFPGYVGQEGLEKAIESARKKASSKAE